MEFPLWDIPKPQPLREGAPMEATKGGQWVRDPQRLVIAFLRGRR